ncbi:AMP-binding protein [Patulibacter defluvii]|uniref:AMP-binding protein n=1 Tax=Patulibacter defluvii TaxID=3095358 RepID=UPI002A753666|nr:AMP-binding protein [Patulibacter sp. DM4]
MSARSAGDGRIVLPPSPAAERYVALGAWSGELVDAALREGARRHPRRLAVVDGDRRWDHATLDAAAERAAAALQRLGVGPGEVVSFQLPNRIEALVVHHAALRIGAVSNPIVPIYREREVGFILRQARSRVLVVPDVFRRFDHRAMAERLRDELPALEHVLVVGEPGPASTSLEAVCAAADGPPAAVERASRDPALLLYTSGTEAEPKGVLHSHDTLLHECRSVIDLYAVDERDVVLMASPVTHITGLLYGMQLPFMVGAPVVLQDTWDVDRALRLIADERCSFTVGATPFLHGIVHAPTLAEHDVSSMRVFVCGGADIPPALIRAARERTAMLATRVYGSTECPTVTGSAPDAPLDQHAESDGTAIAPTELRIVDEAGSPLPTGARGELQVRGPELCLGYLDPALNGKSFTADGWFRTGDLAEVDGDGRMRIAGRMKDIIVRGGENLSAKEIEDLLIEHPAIEEVAVVGAPDPVLGERACAFVVGRAPLELDELVAFLRERRLANQKLPERLELVDALPKTASGKVQKHRLRARLRDHEEAR